MFMGIKRSATSAHDYASAVEALEECTKTPTGRTRQPGYEGYPLNRTRGKNAVAKVRKLSDDSIAFRLYSTDVVTWHPDNTCTIDNWGSVTTSTFAAQFTPSGVSLNIDNTIDYHTQQQPSTRNYDHQEWRSYWQTRRVCQGKHNEVTFRQEDQNWVPIEDNLEPFEIPVLDRKISRAAALEYNLKDFKPWLQLVTYHMEIVHEGIDLAACAEALKRRDFKTAAVHLPTLSVPRGFGLRERMKPLRFRGTRYDEPITMGSLQIVRDYIYGLADAFSVRTATTLSRAEFERIRTRTASLARAKVWL